MSGDSKELVKDGGLVGHDQLVKLIQNQDAKVLFYLRDDVQTSQRQAGRQAYVILCAVASVKDSSRVLLEDFSIALRMASSIWSAFMCMPFSSITVMVVGDCERSQR